MTHFLGDPTSSLLDRYVERQAGVLFFLPCPVPRAVFSMLLSFVWKGRGGVRFLLLALPRTFSSVTQLTERQLFSKICIKSAIAVNQTQP